MSQPSAPDPTALDAWPLRRDEESSAGFLLMGLATKLRHQIYSMGFGCQKASSVRTTWCPRGPKGYMNLLLSNQVISNDAREFLNGQALIARQF